MALWVRSGTLSSPDSHHSPWGWLAASILFFNFLDAFFTIAFLQLGIADELNPFMKQAYQLSPGWFLLGKLGAVQVGISVLFYYRAQFLARFGLALCASIYGLIVLYELAFALRFLG